MKMFTTINEKIRAASSTTSGSTTAEQAETMLNYEEETRAIDQHLLYGDEQKIMEPMELPSMIESKGIGGHTFPLPKVLERPVKIKEVEWSSTQPDDSLFALISPLDELLTNPYIREKISNHKYIKCGMEIYIKLNPQPFHQGALMAALVPPNMGTNITSIISLSYLPHVLINISVMNNALIRVGFISDLEAYHTGGIGETVMLQLMVASALGGATVPYSLRVEIYGMLKNPVLTVPMAQSGDSDLAENAKTGLVTKISGAVADGLELASTALQQIPVVGTFVPPLTWVARAFNKVSSYYGWSKPINVEVAKNVSPAVAWRMCNGEGVDNSVALAISPDNGVDSAKNSVFSPDEMDFSYLLERKHIVARVTFRVNSDPIVMGSNSGGNFSPSDMVLFSFNYARYTAKYEIVFVKTRFHTGRFLIQYYPTSINSLTDLEMENNMTKVYTKVVDIAEVDRVFFTVPYMENVPFKNSVKSMGTVAIGQLTPLDYPDTVADFVQVIVYRSYTDVQVAAPMYCAQGCCDNTEPTIADSLIPANRHDFSQEINGEKVNNLRVLAKRFTIDTYITPNTVFPYTFDKLEESLFATINRHYAYRSGSIRCKIIFPAKYNLFVELLHKGDTTNQMRLSYPVQWFMGHMNNVAEITIPFYADRRRSMDFYPWHSLRINIFDQNLTLLSSLGSNDNIFIYVAAGDDYSAFFPMPSLRETS